MLPAGFGGLCVLKACPGDGVYAALDLCDESQARVLDLEERQVGFVVQRGAVNLGLPDWLVTGDGLRAPGLHMCGLARQSKCRCILKKIIFDWWHCMLTAA